MIENYSREYEWSGRVDSETDYDCFRWHQLVEIIDLNSDDLKPFEGKLGYAFIGFKCDAGIDINKGRVGAANGPEAIRKQLSNLPCEFSQEVKLFDAGNISVEGITLNEAQENLAKAVDKILDLNLFPIVLGGGHEVAYGHYLGLFNNYNKKTEKKDDKIGIINFDAHFDVRPYQNGVGSSGTMFRQIRDLNKSHGKDYSYFCIGIQRHSNTLSLFNFAKEEDVKYVLAKEIDNSDVYATLDKLDKFIEEQDHIYVTVCSDVFSSAYAPGVSAPQPFGLDPEKMLIILKYIIAHNKMISFDIAEVSPRFDQDNVTASLAAVIIYTLVVSLAKLR